MKVLFVIHELDFADHIAIAYLSAIAKQLGHSTFFCSLDSSNLSEAVKRIRPDVVAYSANIVGFNALVEAHKKATRLHSFVSIMGGPHPTYSPETFQESGMDAYCRGEGEYAFRDFLLRVEEGKPFDDVLNLITQNRENPVRPLIANLNELPMPDRDLVLSNSFLKDTPKKTGFASRGCAYSCTYCCNNYYHKLYRGKGPVVRRFSVERVIQEIAGIKSKYRMDFFKFGDDAFALRADSWLEEFAEKYPGKIGVPFNCFLRLDLVDSALLKLLKQAGCFSVHLSVDSTSHHVREDILGRHMRSEDLVSKLKLIQEYKINTWVNYMLAAPESSLQDDLDTIKLSKEGKVTYPAYSTTMPMKGTDLYDYSVAHDLLDPTSHKSDMAGCSEKTTLSCFSEKEKNIRFNIYLLGAVIAKLPWPLDRIALSLIRVIPPNWVFRKVRHAVYEHYISNRIFKLKEEKHGSS